MTARIEIPKDRKTEGRLILDGSVYRCLARSDQESAAAHGNPTRDPIKPYGDLPAGEYRATRSAPKGSTIADARSYGRGPVWVLNPVGGDALKALHNGRYGLLIHGGDTGAPMPPNALRPTHGCLRVDNATIEALAARTGDESFPVEVFEV